MALRKRGRPAFKATPALREKVELLVASGMSQDNIAHVIGCSDVTLREYFHAELAHGAAKKRAEMIELLRKNAKRGNVTAQRTLATLFDQTVAAQTFTAPEAADEKPAKAPKLGKKEAAAQEAESAGVGTAWGDDLHIGTGRTLN